MANTEQTTADKALASKPVAQPAKPTAKPAEAVEKKSNSGFKPGIYRAEKQMRIIREITYKDVKDANGQVTKTYGTWAKPENMINFVKGGEVHLTAADVALPAIQNLIKNKTIFRVGD